MRPMRKRYMDTRILPSSPRDRAFRLFNYSRRRMRLAGEFLHARGLCPNPTASAALKVTERLVRRGAVPGDFRRFLRELSS